MATSLVNVGHAPYFDGDRSNFDYWKTCMRIHLKAMGGILWKVVDEGFVILDEAHPTYADNENILANAQAMNVIIRAFYIREYHRVCKLETAHGMWGKLIEAHEGTSNVKSAKLFICNGKFEKFALLPNEELKDYFSRLNNIVNELKDLGFDVPEVDISHNFHRALPPKYETILTLLVRSNLKTISPSEVLGEVLTHDIFKQSQEELHGNLHENKKKIVAFKARTSNDDDHDGDSETSTDDDVALMVKKFKRFMKKKAIKVVLARMTNFIVKVLLLRRNALSVVKWIISPLIARTKMKIILARSLKERKSYSRSITRRKVARLAMLSGIQMQVWIPILVMMMMLNALRRVLSALPSRRLYLYSAHRIILWQKVN
jgi:hypothetical protein